MARKSGSARAIFDKRPLIEGDGYVGSLYSPHRRYWYMSISETF